MRKILFIFFIAIIVSSSYSTEVQRTYQEMDDGTGFFVLIMDNPDGTCRISYTITIKYEQSLFLSFLQMDRTGQTPIVLQFDALLPIEYVVTPQSGFYEIPFKRVPLEKWKETYLPKHIVCAKKWGINFFILWLIPIVLIIISPLSKIASVAFTRMAIHACFI